MDSMRSLNTSLPRSPPKQPPEQLLQAFKTAALSVTNLYKTAASDQAQARSAGYQSALDDLLAFLDKHNLGLGDGEGWEVRQWATERLDGSPVPMGNDSDDDRGETVNQAGSSDPPVLPRSETLNSRQTSRPASPPRTASTASQTSTPIQQPSVTSAPRSEIFSFTTPYLYPQDMDVQSSETAHSNTAQLDNHPPTPGGTATSTVRLEVVPPRAPRTPHRTGNHSGRHGARSSASVRSLGSSAGSKRKMHFPDYFDLGNFRDGEGGAANEEDIFNTLEWSLSTMCRFLEGDQGLNVHD